MAGPKHRNCPLFVGNFTAAPVDPKRSSRDVRKLLTHRGPNGRLDCSTSSGAGARSVPNPFQQEDT